MAFLQWRNWRGKRQWTLAALLAALALVTAACGGAGDAETDNQGQGGEAPEATELVVGATPVPHAEILEHIAPVLEERGVDLQVETFDDYVQPNLALDNDELDANYFQHIPYLTSFNEEREMNLTWLAKVHIEPMGLYSEQYGDVGELPDGAQIAIPSSPTASGRALLLLQANDLVTLEEGAGYSALPADIAENPQGFEFTQVEPAQAPRTLPDVAAAVINGNYAIESGLNPAEDALVIEDADSPYANVLAVNEGDEGGEAVQALAEVLVSDDVTDFIDENWEGSVVPAQQLREE